MKNSENEKERKLLAVSYYHRQTKRLRNVHTFLRLSPRKMNKIIRSKGNFRCPAWSLSILKMTRRRYSRALVSFTSLWLRFEKKIKMFLYTLSVIEKDVEGLSLYVRLEG